MIWSPTRQVRAAAPLRTQQREPGVEIHALEFLFQISTNSIGRIPATWH
jgi:hypothetical protein